MYDDTAPLLVILFLVAAVTGIISWNIGYKQGQIAAISGVRIKYELVEEYDGAVNWERIENE